MDGYTRAHLRVEIAGDRALVRFTRGEVQIQLSFPAEMSPEQEARNADDLTVLVDNLEDLIDHANLEIEAAILRQEVMTDE